MPLAEIKNGHHIALALPVLDHIPVGTYNLGAPVKNDSIQVGIQGRPEGFARVNLLVTADHMEISRYGSDLQIESGILVDDDYGMRRMARAPVLEHPQSLLLLNKSSGFWVTESHNVVSRTGLVRFAAKLAGVAAAKNRRKTT